MTETERELRFFAYLVRDMLAAQRLYYRVRTQATLNKAKALEKRADERLASILGQQNLLLMTEKKG